MDEFTKIAIVLALAVAVEALAIIIVVSMIHMIEDDRHFITSEEAKVISDIRTKKMIIKESWRYEQEKRDEYHEGARDFAELLKNESITKKINEDMTSSEKYSDFIRRCLRLFEGK